MRFWLGLAIGLVVGAAAMYLGLRPWRGSGKPTVAAVTPDEVGAGSGSGSGKKKKPHGHARRHGDPGDPGTGDDGGDGGDGGGGDVSDTEETEPPIVLTEADRRLEWRGDDVTLPPRTFDMSDGKDGRPLEDGEIREVINRRGSKVIDCLVREATGAADLVATVTLKLVVTADGKVSKVKVQAPHYLFEQGLLACARRAAATFDFPATGAPSSVIAPFELNK